MNLNCSWCGQPIPNRARWAGVPTCSGRCRTAAYRARRKTSPKALGELLTGEAERVEVLAGQARNSGTNDGLYVAELLRRMATKLRDTAGMIDPDQLPF